LRAASPIQCEPSPSRTLIDYEVGCSGGSRSKAACPAIAVALQAASWCCRLGAEALTPSRPNCPARKREACISCVEVWSDPGTAPYPSGPAFFLANFFLDAAGARETCRPWEPSFNRRSSSDGRRGDIAACPTTGLPNSALSWLECRRPCCWLGAARHIPPAEEETGCLVGNRRRCWMLWGTRLASSLDVSCWALDGDAEVPYQTDLAEIFPSLHLCSSMSMSMSMSTDRPESGK
jgi:hypothetical protein